VAAVGLTRNSPSYIRGNGEKDPFLLFLFFHTNNTSFLFFLSFSLFLFARTHTTRSLSLLFRFHFADTSEWVLFRQTLILCRFSVSLFHFARFLSSLPIAIMVVWSPFQLFDSRLLHCSFHSSLVSSLSWILMHSDSMCLLLSDYIACLLLDWSISFFHVASHAGGRIWLDWLFGMRCSGLKCVFLWCDVISWCVDVVSFVIQWCFLVWL